MKEVIKNLKFIIIKTKMSIDNKIGVQLTKNDLEILKKAIIYLELINDLADSYKGDRHA